LAPEGAVGDVRPGPAVGAADVAVVWLLPELPEPELELELEPQAAAADSTNTVPITAIGQRMAFLIFSIPPYL
jgi:hypothetical protein